MLARGSWALAGAGRTYVFARGARGAAARAGRRLAATLRLTATDAAGNRRTVKPRSSCAADAPPAPGPAGRNRPPASTIRS